MIDVESLLGLACYSSIMSLIPGTTVSELTIGMKESLTFLETKHAVTYCIVPLALISNSIGGQPPEGV